MKKFLKKAFRIIEKISPYLAMKIYFFVKGNNSSLQETAATIEEAQAKQVEIQNKHYYNLVFDKKKNVKINPNKIDIAFIVPQPIQGSGGHRNFYRAIKYLRDFGHEMTVYYTQTTEPADIVKQRISDWFYDMSDIPYICYDGKLGYHDAVVATWWETAYMLSDNINMVKSGFYYVQDFEPAFYPVCSNYILAENSYQLGLSHICSGKWCKDFLVDKYKAEAEYFNFPVDKQIYNIDTPRTKKNKNVIFFAKPDLDRRCYELGLMALRELHKVKPEVEIILFGSNHVNKSQIDFQVTVLGLLPTLKDLSNLYRNADLGIVFSTTNPSLVPYEMLSCGCPVVDMDLEKAVSKYGGSDEHVFLCSLEPKKMAKQISDILDDPEAMRYKSLKGREWVLNTFPTELEMARMVEKMIKNKLLKGDITL